MISKENKDFIFFIAECLIGTVIGFVFYNWYSVIGGWSLISIILVLSPDKRDAVMLATNRIKANLIGASVGLIISYFPPISLVTICLGVAAVMLICKLVRLETVIKTAVVSILIITMHEPGKFFWDNALERAAGVAIGCIIGIVLTYIFHLIRVRTSGAFPKDSPVTGDHL